MGACPIRPGWATPSLAGQANVACVWVSILMRLPRIGLLEWGVHSHQPSSSHRSRVLALKIEVVSTNMVCLDLLLLAYFGGMLLDFLAMFLCSACIGNHDYSPWLLLAHLEGESEKQWWLSLKDNYHILGVLTSLFFCFFGTWSSGYRTSLTFFNSGDYVEFQANCLGNNAHKIAYMWLLVQTVCGKLWKNVGDDLHWNIVKCGWQFAQHWSILALPRSSCLVKWQFQVILVVIWRVIAITYCHMASKSICWSAIRLPPSIFTSWGHAKQHTNTHSDAAMSSNLYNKI